MGRVNLAEIARDPGTDAPAPALRVPPSAAVAVPVRRVAPNPINPRELDVDADLGDLESMAWLGQLQPCVVVTVAAFTGIYPEHAVDVAGADWVVVAGSRRRMAAERLGLGTLDVQVRDALAASRERFYAVAIAENLDRKALDPIEEAFAVERLVRECGSGTAAAKILGRTEGWVSQRRSLTKLAAEMRALVRSGELPIRDARRLARLPDDQQVAAWQDEQQARVEPAVGGSAPPDDGSGVLTAVKTSDAQILGQPGTGASSGDSDRDADGPAAFTAVKTSSAGPGPAGHPDRGPGQTFTAVKKVKHRIVIPVGADAGMIARLLREDLEAAILAELVDQLISA